MSKQSWKLRSLGPEAAEVVRSSSSRLAAAKRLNIHVSTVSRRVKSGAWPAPGAPVRHSAATSAAPGADSDTFKAWARATFVLSRAELEVVSLTQMALDIACDPASAPSVRLQAMAQVRGLLKHLNLPVDSEHGDIPKTSWPRRA